MTDALFGDTTPVAPIPASPDGGQCFIPGVPVPQGSKRGFINAHGHVAIVDANTKARPWRADITAHVRDTIGPAILYPAEHPVALTMEFIMPRRAAEPKRVTPPHIRKPDTDKLSRAVLDALAGVVYAQDQQVTTMHASKRTAQIGEQPGLRVGWCVDRDAYVVPRGQS